MKSTLFLLLILILISDVAMATIIAAFITAILSGSLLVAITQARKAKPEIALVTVEIAGKAVVVQKGVIESLQNELLRQGAELVSQENEIKKLEQENVKCQAENREFRRTIENLERQIGSHHNRIENIEKKQGE